MRRRISARLERRSSAGTAGAGSVPSPQPVVVLGMSHSGASVTSDILAALGIDFGKPATPAPPDSLDTSQRTWDQTPIYYLNDRILTSLGSSWFQPTPNPVDVTSVKEIEDYRREAKGLLSHHSFSDRRWGLKDPRLGVLMDFWRPLLDSPYFVVCVRDPREVLESQRHRSGDSHPYPPSYESWQRHTTAALRATAGAPRLVVDYGALIEDTTSQVERIGRFVGVDEPAALEAAANVVQRSQRHHEVVKAITHDTDVPSPVVDLYATASRLARLSVSPRSAMPVLWLTGLPGAGKSTIADLAAQGLIAEGVPVEVLDGDEVRNALSPTLGFSREERALQAKRLAWLAAMLSRHGIVPIIAAVSPYRHDRESAAESLGDRFAEVWVHADAAVCRARDPKGLWKRCERGEITGLTGFDSPYEDPLAANLKLNTETRSAASCASELVAYVVARRVNALLNNR